MKLIYKLMVFLAMFQCTVVIVNMLDNSAGSPLFPEHLYSDVETSDFREFDSIMDPLEYFFKMPEFHIGKEVVSSGVTSVSFALIAGMFLFGGALVSIMTRNPSLISVVVLAIMFVPMITKSYGFFQKLKRSFTTFF